MFNLNSQDLQGICKTALLSAHSDPEVERSHVAKNQVSQVKSKV